LSINPPASTESLLVAAEYAARPARELLVHDNNSDMVVVMVVAVVPFLANGKCGHRRAQ